MLARKSLRLLFAAFCIPSAVLFAQEKTEPKQSDERLLASAPDGVIIEPNLAYREGDSKAWRLDLIRPQTESDKPRPAIVFVHGSGSGLTGFKLLDCVCSQACL